MGKKGERSRARVRGLRAGGPPGTLLGPPSRPVHQDPGAAWGRAAEGGSEGSGRGQGEWGGRVRGKWGCVARGKPDRKGVGRLT